MTSILIASEEETRGELPKRRVESLLSLLGERECKGGESFTKEDGVEKIPRRKRRRLEE